MMHPFLFFVIYIYICVLDKLKVDFSSVELQSSQPAEPIPVMVPLGGVGLRVFLAPSPRCVLGRVGSRSFKKKRCKPAINVRVLGSSSWIFENFGEHFQFSSRWLENTLGMGSVGSAIFLIL